MLNFSKLLNATTKKKPMSICDSLVKNLDVNHENKSRNYNDTVKTQATTRTTVVINNSGNGDITFTLNQPITIIL